MWDSVFDFVEDPTIATLVLPALQKLMPGLLGVSLNQLIDFLQGGKFGVPPAAYPEGLDHCPLTNLLGENVFGDFDFDIQKHRNSTLQNRSARQMVAHNKTPEWLNKKEDVEKTHLLHFARKKAPGLMQQRRRQEKLVFLKLRERMAQQEATRQMKAAKLAQQKAELIQRIAEQGGACTVRADVSLLLRGLRRRGQKGTVLVEAVKDQVRYQKCVLGQKGQLKLSGTVIHIWLSSFTV
ncbi:uncharacterized protein [Littorina saxatilis]|uniref:uncharacterized protein n=1 Tax=Littorina saxatilis TaxID=31220 RepID=UPI0038B5EF1B